MQLITSSRSHFPLWARASLLVGAIALSACSTSKPSASAASPQANAGSNSSAASAPVKKCWFGLFTCSPSAASEKNVAVARPNIVTVTASSDTSEKASNQKAIESVIVASATDVKVAPAQTAAAPVASAAPPAPAQRGWLGFLSPYKMDIQQGNFISHEVAAKLREGMSKEQVRFLLGAPLLNDMFHAERWDYVFRLQKGNGPLTSTRLTVFFKDNQVARFNNTPLPNEAEYLNHISGADGKKKAPTPANNISPDKAPEKPVAPTTANNS